MIPLDRRKLGIRSWTVERKRKGLRTSRDWGSLGHLYWLWGHYPGMLGFQLTVFLLEGVVGVLHMLHTLVSLEGLCVG